MRRRFVRSLRLPMPVLACGLMLAFGAVAAVSAQDAPAPLTSSQTTQVRLRGLSAVNDQLAWASGVKGTVIRTSDGGTTWQNVSVPNTDALDFRDIQAFSADEAIVLAAGPGQSSKLYRTVDGGATWTLVLQNLAADGFYDCMVFEGDHGWMMGDPIEGRYQIFESLDRGAHWAQSANGTPAAKDEAAFAASGTCIARNRNSTFVATGGAQANLHMKVDGMGVWQKFDSGMGRAVSSAGVFSAAPMGERMMLVGGDYKLEKQPGNAAIYSNGKLKAIPAPPGYRSGVACFADSERCVAVGPSGADVWDGKGWRRVSTESWDTVAVAGDSAWMSGVKGRVARFEQLNATPRAGDATP